MNAELIERLHRYVELSREGQTSPGMTKAMEEAISALSQAAAGTYADKSNCYTQAAAVPEHNWRAAEREIKEVLDPAYKDLLAALPVAYDEGFHEAALLSGSDHAMNKMQTAAYWSEKEKSIQRILAAIAVPEQKTSPGCECGVLMRPDPLNNNYCLCGLPCHKEAR